MNGLILPLLGKTKKIRADLAAHIALNSGVHGAVSTATPSRLVIRDANGRAKVASPSTSSDIATKGYVDSGLATKGTVNSVTAGAGLTGGQITSAGTIALATTGVSAGSYSNVSLTVDAYGRLTAVSNGASAVTSVGANSPLASSGGVTPTITLQAATTSQHGYMSSSDKSKLNGIASGAQVNTVTSVFGRTGAVTAGNNDYDVTQIQGVTVSTASPSGGANGHIWFKV